MIDSKKETPLYRWLKSNLDETYEVTSSKYQTFGINHVTISKPQYFQVNL